MDTRAILQIIASHKEKERDGRINAILRDIHKACGYLSPTALDLVASETGCTLEEALRHVGAANLSKLWPTDGGLPQTLTQVEESDAQVDPRCPTCNHTLIDWTYSIDGRPSMCVVVSFGEEHGWLRICTWKGGHHVQSEHKLPRRGIVNLFCPHCHAEILPPTQCRACDSPLVLGVSNDGTLAPVCPRFQCKSHTRTHEETASPLRKGRAAS